MACSHLQQLVVNTKTSVTCYMVLWYNGTPNYNYISIRARIACTLQFFLESLLTCVGASYTYEYLYE